jgi:hypothetical protein
MNASYKLTSAIKKPSAITSQELMSVNAKMALVETDFCATMWTNAFKKETFVGMFIKNV